MRKLSLLLALAVLGGCVVAANAWGRENKEKVLLSDVQTLTLQRGSYTTGRRSAPVPQLKCVGGEAHHHAHEIDVVQCYNKGSNGMDIQWKCETELDSKYKLGRLEVTCEGYDHPDDPYILRGSCGLEYNLEYTEQGRKQQYQQHQQQQQRHHDNYNTYSNYQHHNDYHYDHSSGGGFKIKNLILFGIVVFIFYNVYKQCTGGSQQGSRGSSGNGGGYGGGGGNNWGPGGGPGSGPYDSCNPPPPTYSSWRPGFWSGLATGGFLGNMFRPSYRTYPRYSTASYGSGFGGGSFGGGGGGSSSSSSRTSAGFGGTRRR